MWSWLSFLNLDVFNQSGGGVCVAPLEPIVRMQLGLFAPLLLFSLQGVLFLVHKVRHEQKDGRNNVIEVYLMSSQKEGG